MAFHTTNSGSIDRVDTWGRGKTASAEWRNVPAVIVVDDGDGGMEAWKFTGTRADAAAKAASFISTHASEYVIIDDGDTVHPIKAPADLFKVTEWEDGEPVDWAEQPDPAIVKRMNIVHY